MLNLISQSKIISQGQDYALVGDNKIVISSGLSKEEANDYSYKLKKGEIVANTLCTSSINDLDLNYWKGLSNYPLGEAHTLVPVKFVSDMQMVNRTIIGNDNHWVFMSGGKALISVVKLGGRRGVNLPLKEFKTILDKTGVALACKLY